MKITAVIPDLQSSIQVSGGEGEVTRLKLDLYNPDLNELTKLRGKQLIVEIKEDE